MLPIVGIVLVGAALTGLSLRNLRRLEHLPGWHRAIRALMAGGIALFYLLVLVGQRVAVEPIAPGCFRAMLFVMLSGGLAREISTTPRG